MSRFGAGFAVIGLLVFLTVQTTARFWRPVRPTLPSNPNAKFYKAFRAVPAPQVTAKKLMTNFLHINPGASGRRKRQKLYEDVVVVMDGSGSVGKCEFDKGKKALKNMIQLAKESPDYDTKYAAVTFASSATVNFKFLPYGSAANKIIKIGYPNGWTNTQAGLEEAKKLFVNPTSSGGRLSASRMVLLVTDGQSNEKRHLTIPRANSLKNIGVKIYVVAVGSYNMGGIDEMVKVASYPPKDFVFRVKKNSAFWEVIKLIIKQVAPAKYKAINYDPPCYYG